MLLPAVEPQGREGEASQALKQAQRFGLSDAGLLEQLGDRYTELGRFDSGADCLARSAAALDGVKVCTWVCLVYGWCAAAAACWLPCRAFALAC